MATSDSHLEKALVEFNSRVDALECETPSAELVDALVKRSRILAAMDFKLSADEDLEEAYDVMNGLLASGVEVSADICFRTHVALAFSFRMVDDESMHSHFIKASSYLKKLEDPTFAARACVDCASELLEIEDVPSARVFLRTAFCLRGSEDRTHMNTLLQALFLMAESHVSVEQYSAALPFLVEAVEIGSRLLEENAVKDILDLILCYVYLADNLVADGNKEAARANLDVVSSILDDKSRLGTIESSVLGEIHGQIGRDYVEIGDIETAERHLMKQAALSLSGDDGILREAIERRMGDDE